MKRTKKLKSGAGFSLVELVVVIAVIGLIAAIALPSVSKITDKARKVSAQKNAQTLCSLHHNAKTAGAGFSATTRGGILDELVAGVTGTIVESDFQMGALSEDDKTEALKYCSYDASEGMLSYYPEGDAPDDDGGCSSWSDWRIVTGGFDTKALADAWAVAYGDGDASKDYKSELLIPGHWEIFERSCND